MNCRWVASDQPRILPGRHDADCAGECDGCLPCPDYHCSVCRRVHVEGRTCAECLAETRDDLTQVRLMCGALPAEVRHRGVNGEAMTLLGISADPEAWQYVEASYLAGRLPEGWIETTHGKGCPTLVNEPCLGCKGDERHPLAVLGTWEMVWRDYLEHETDAKSNVHDAAAYLNQQMTYMAQRDEVPFEDFARDVRRCRAHLEDVLHAGDRDETGAPCVQCEEPMVRVVTDQGAQDAYNCKHCHRTVTGNQYRYAIGVAYIAHADRLTATDMAQRFSEDELKATVVRVWGARDLIRKRGTNDQGLTLYDVSDVAARLATMREECAS